MKIENLRKIIQTLNPGIELKEDDGIFYISDFSVYQTENPVLIRGIVERPHPKNKTWMVMGTSYDDGDRDTPASQDVYDIQEFDYFEDAIKFILVLLKTREIDHIFQSYGETEWAEEERKMLEQSDVYFS